MQQETSRLRNRSTVLSDTLSSVEVELRSCRDALERALVDRDELQRQAACHCAEIDRLRQVTHFILLRTNKTSDEFEFIIFLQYFRKLCKTLSPTHLYWTSQHLITVPKYLYFSNYFLPIYTSQLSCSEKIPIYRFKKLWNGLPKGEELQKAEQQQYGYRISCISGYKNTLLIYSIIKLCGGERQYVLFS